MKTFFSLVALLALLGVDRTPASAQRSGAPEIPRIGLLASEAPTNGAYQQHLRAFLQGLQELGYVEGQNLIIEYRHASGKLDLLPQLAGDLVAANVSVILPTGPTALAPLMEVTQKVPIVVINADPKWISSVKSDANPGGNVTGLTGRAEGLAEKRLEMRKSYFRSLRAS